MTSLRLDPSFECAPHATRSIAMALTLAFNLAIVLFALLPNAPHMLRPPPPQSLLAAIVEPLPPPVLPPAVPELHVAKRVATPTVHVAVAHPRPMDATALPTLVPLAPVPAALPGANAAAPAADSDATIAYETATPPAYPIRALRDRVQGTVLLKVLVDATGKPVRVLIERSSGSRVLDDAARRHVLAAWRFHPAMQGGHAIEAWAVVPVRFDLDRG